MKKSVIGMMMFLAMAVGAQANLLTNGDFNTGDLTGWWTYVPDSSTQSITVESSGTYDGSPDVVMVSATSGTWQQLGQSGIACSVNTTYTLTFAYMSTGWVGAGISVNYYDASGNYLDYDWTSFLSTSTEGTGEWTTYTCTFDTTNTDAASMTVIFVSGHWGSLYIDDASVTPEPATMLLLGLGGVLLRKKA